jgi:hypothetical protein
MRILISLLLLITLLACEKEKKESGNPEWLTELISELENDPYYDFSYLCRWTYRETYFYEVNNMISSCAYCEVYDAGGSPVTWEIMDLDDFLAKRTDYLLIWEGTAFSSIFDTPNSLTNTL